MISERIIELNAEKVIKGKKTTKSRKLYLCFVDYPKAFVKVKHDKLAIYGEGWYTGAGKKSNHKSLDSMLQLDEMEKSVER